MILVLCRIHNTIWHIWIRRRTRVTYLRSAFFGQRWREWIENGSGDYWDAGDMYVLITRIYVRSESDGDGGGWPRRRVLESWLLVSVSVSIKISYLSIRLDFDNQICYPRILTTPQLLHLPGGWWFVSLQGRPVYLWPGPDLTHPIRTRTCQEASECFWLPMSPCFGTCTKREVNRSRIYVHPLKYW